MSILATIPCVMPPSWALAQRHLFDVLNRSVQPYLDKYARPDGSLVWNHDTAGSPDDFYEAFFNWPLLYSMGGADHLLERSHHHWSGITRQLEGYGLSQHDYAFAEDQFHQAESDISFYNLCLADPNSEINVERARRFADMYTGDDPEAANYDRDNRVIRSAINGSGGPKLDFYGPDHAYRYSPGMARYGLPYYDLTGIEGIEDLKDEENARRMGQTMARRMGRGDAVTNLGVTSLVTNAYLLTGEERYRQWVLDYTEAWAERAVANGGLLPDNVGLSGKVGEHIDGHWYGALYGWTWPHGFYNIQMSALAAAANAQLLTGDAGYLELPRRQMDRILELGETRDLRQCQMSLPEHWIGQNLAMGERSTETFVVPYRYGDAGWFDFQPMSPIFPVSLWNQSMSPEDWQRVEDLRFASEYDWNAVFSFRTKEDAGHEQPWARFIGGHSPQYPEHIIAATLGEISRRLELIRDDEDTSHRNVHLWQEVNPVSTEALVQLTLGAPQTIYNGGLLMSRVRYFDTASRRPGLPADVAALVETLTADRTVLTLINLNPLEERRLSVRAGAFGEHRFTEARYDRRTSSYPGTTVDYAAEPLSSTIEIAEVNDTDLSIVLPPAMQIRLDLGTDRFVNRPSARAL